MKTKNPIAIIADAFPPMRTSAAVQLRDLAREFTRQGVEIIVLLPSSEIELPWQVERIDGFLVLRLKASKTKDIGYVMRTLNESLMPFEMYKNLQSSPYADVVWDGIVWYSPSIFFGPLVHRLKKKSSCPSYLIIRDIFPEWAVDMQLMGRGLPYLFFKLIENFQYSVADTIAVQTEGNLSYFDKWKRRTGRNVEVLQNWLAESPNRGCTISIEKSTLAGRFIFVYAGNMGVAQGVDIFLHLASKLQDRADIGFVFVGRGSDAKRLAELSAQRRLNNVLFFDEVDPDEISGLYSQCHIGIVSLDIRHKTHNIPGKFISYMRNGLPVLAKVNLGNDIEELIQTNRVGRVVTDNSIEKLYFEALKLVEQLGEDLEMKKRCTEIGSKLFSPTVIVGQILNSMNLLKSFESGKLGS